jgi:adenylosuccinate synthase
VIHKALEAGDTVLLEGAQGTLLDIDHGTYPFVTRSNAVGGGGCTGTGIGPVRISRMTGVTKAYCTRVGSGPFPTEAEEDAATRLRDRGGEYGATTGRPRRCGWLDLVALKHAVRVNGLTGIALTKLDVLSGEKDLPVCVAYSHEGRRDEDFKGGYSYLENVKPVFQKFAGWQEDISRCDTWESLPEEARKYVTFIEEQTGVPVVFIGVGAKREQMIRRGL